MKLPTLLILTALLKYTFAHTYGEVNYLLQTNALNYSENFEKDSEVYGHCIAGTPESNLKADAQTTRDDEKCQVLVSDRVVMFVTALSIRISSLTYRFFPGPMPYWLHPSRGVCCVRF